MADSLYCNYTPMQINSIFFKAKGLHGDSETLCPLSQLPLRTHFFLSLSLFKKYLFIWLPRVLVAALGIFSCGMQYSWKLPRWFSGYRLHLQYSRQRFDPWIGKIPGGGLGKPLQYSCLENPMDRGPWWTTVHGVAKSWTRLSN